MAIISFQIISVHLFFLELFGRDNLIYGLQKTDWNIWDQLGSGNSHVLWPNQSGRKLVMTDDRRLSITRIHKMFSQPNATHVCRPIVNNVIHINVDECKVTSTIITNLCACFKICSIIKGTFFCQIMC